MNEGKRVNEAEPSRDDLEQCKLAIHLYLETLGEVGGGGFFRDIEGHIRHIEADAQQLLTGTDGLLYGTPNWIHSRLIYIRHLNDDNAPDKFFMIIPNGLDEERFRPWEEIVQRKFEANRLPFKPYNF